MGHIGVKGLHPAVTGIDLDDSTHQSCITCAQANIKRQPFPRKSFHRAEKPLQRIHSDICGPLPHCYGNFSYYILFIDCYARYVSLFFLKNRDEALGQFIQYRTAAENFLGERIAILRVDNAPELTRGKMEQYCKAHGITYEKTVPDSPPQNGVAERTNLTVATMARAMLIDANLSDYFWPFATQAAIHIKNRVPHSALPPDKTPFELWHRYKPNLGHLRLFGAPCTSRILSSAPSKFSPRGETGRFLGYAKDAKGYLVWIPNPTSRGGTVKTRRDVIVHDLPSRPDVPPITPVFFPLWHDVPMADRLAPPFGGSTAEPSEHPVPCNVHPLDEHSVPNPIMPDVEPYVE